MFGKAKKYISLKEASKISGYSSDYLGWLIRKGKLRGERVYLNTSWLVLKNDLIKFVRSRASKKSNPGGLDKLGRMGNLGARDYLSFKKKYLSLREAAKISGYTPDYIGQLVRKGKIKGKKVYSGTAWLIEEKILRNYLKKIENDFISKAQALKKKQRQRTLKNIRLIHDIFPPELVLNAAREITGWKPYKSKKDKIFGIGWRFSLAVFIFLLIIGVGPVEIFEKIVKAFSVGEKQITNFYPSNCYGGWENPQNVQGKFEEDEVFDQVNSAILRNTIASIFCEDFTGEIPENTNIEKASLKFSWAFKEELTEFRIPASNNIGTGSGGGAPSIESSGPGPEVKPESAPTQNQNPAPAPKATPPLQDNKGLPIEIPSVIREIFNPVFAQEEKNSPTEKTLIEELIEQPLQSVSPKEEERNPTSNQVEQLPSSEQENLISQEQVREISEKNSSSGAFLEVFYRLDENWQSLGKVGRDNWQDYSLEIPLSDWDEIGNLEVKIEGLMGFDEQPVVYLNSVWLEVTYKEESEELIEKSEDFRLKAFKEDWRADEGPEFTIERINRDGESELNESFLEKIIGGVKGFLRMKTKTPEMKAPDSEEVPELKEVILETPAKEIYKVKNPMRKKEALLGPQVELKILSPKIGSSIAFQLYHKGYFKPGEYGLKAKIEWKGKKYLLEEKFTWGVFVINMNKSSYSPFEEAYIQIAALDEYGHIICDANLKLEIENPEFKTMIFTTEDKTIIRNKKCARDNVTDKPDYSAYYQTSGPGSYKFKLTNLDKGYEIEDSFEVKETFPFNVERLSATRINPFQTDYSMIIRIQATKDFSGKIIETLPLSFKIVNISSSREIDWQEEEGVANRKIIWSLSLQKGEWVTLRYKYDAPDLSPYLWLLGPLRFEGKVIFQEARRWQLVADASCISGDSGNWSEISWINCKEVPQSGDTVTIADGHRVNLDVSTTIAGLTLCDAVCLNGASLTHSGTSSLTINGPVTVNGSSRENGNTIWDIAAGSASASEIISYNLQFITGGAKADIQISTGTLKINGIIFENSAGSQENKRFVVNGTNQVNLKSAMGNQTGVDISLEQIKPFNLRPGSAVEIYWLDNPEAIENPDPESKPSNVYAVLVSDDSTLNMDVATLGPGSYVLVNTFEPEYCGGLYLSQCRERNDYLGEIYLIINP